MTIGEYLRSLATEADALEDFYEDPVAAMNEAEVSIENQYLILTGNLEAIQKAVLDESGSSATLFVMIWWPWRRKGRKP